MLKRSISLESIHHKDSFFTRVLKSIHNSNRNNGDDKKLIPIVTSYAALCPLLFDLTKDHEFKRLNTLKALKQDEEHECVCWLENPACWVTLDQWKQVTLIIVVIVCALCTFILLHTKVEPYSTFEVSSRNYAQFNEYIFEFLTIIFFDRFKTPL
jgi:hypothetical protein